MTWFGLTTRPNLECLRLCDEESRIEPKGPGIGPHETAVRSVTRIQQDVELLGNDDRGDLDSKLADRTHPCMARCLAGHDIAEAHECQKRWGRGQVGPRPHVAPRQLALVEMNQHLDAREREVLRRVQHGRSDGIPAAACHRGSLVIARCPR